MRLPSALLLLAFAGFAPACSARASLDHCGTAFDDTPESPALGYQVHMLAPTELNHEQTVSRSFQVTHVDPANGQTETHSFVRTNSGIWNLTYVPKDFVCLSELSRVLKPGGMAYLQWADTPRMRVLLRSVPGLFVASDPELPDTLVLRRVR